MKTSSVMGFAVIVSVASAFLSTSAGVFDDAYFYCRGALDRNGDGYPVRGDFPDALHATYNSADPWHKIYAYTLSGDTSRRLGFSAEEVIEPATCRSLGRHQCLKFTQPLYDNEGVTYLAQQSVIVTEALNGEKPVDATGWAFYIRFRADGGVNLANDSDAQVVLNYHNSWDSKGGGVMLWVNGSPTNGYLAVQQGSARKDLTDMKAQDCYRLCTNKWTDVIVTKKDDKVDVYSIREGGRLYHASYTSARTESGYMSNCTLGSYDLKPNPLAYVAANTRNFRGSVHSLAIWRRVLSEAEAEEILFPTGTEKFRLGTHNGSSLEFAGTGSPTVDPDSANGWSSSLATIGAGQSLSVMFNMKKEECALDETLFFTATPDSAAGMLAVTLNGAAAGSFSAEPGKTVGCFVRKGSFVEGENVLTLSNASGGAVGVDAISFGGSWQLLKEDGSEAGGAAQNGLKDFHLNDTNLVADLKSILHVGQDISNTNLTFHFTVPADLVGTVRRVRFVIRGKQAKNWRWDGNMPDFIFRVLVNGEARGNLVIPKGDTGFHASSLTIPAEALVAGENTIRMENATPPWYDPADYPPPNKFPSCYMPVDFYRLEVMKDPDGLMLILK